jgi:hypothetical protein
VEGSPDHVLMRAGVLGRGPCATGAVHKEFVQSFGHSLCVSDSAILKRQLMGKGNQP